MFTEGNTVLLYPKLGAPCGGFEGAITYPSDLLHFF